MFCTCVKTGTIGFHERGGRFIGIREPGCHTQVPCLDEIKTASTKVMHGEMKVESKTLDDVFVILNVSVMYRFVEYERAFYTLTNPGHQMKAYVFDAIRGLVPEYTVDDLFLVRDQIASAVQKALESQMRVFGVGIVAVLITDLRPDGVVIDAMNRINTYARLKIAAMDAAETYKIKAVMAAEAQCEAARLSGHGIAAMRTEIFNGLSEAAGGLTALEGTTASDVMSLLLLNQYFDMMKEISKGKTKVIFTSPPKEVAKGFEHLQLGMK